MKWIDRFKSDVDDMRKLAARQTGAVALDDAPGPKRETVVALSEQQLSDYQRVAEKIGFAPKGLKSDELRRFLCDSGIRCYPLAKVVTYLDEQYGKPRTQDSAFGKQTVAAWVWRPLRRADMSRPTMWVNGMASRPTYTENGAIGSLESPYGKALPLPVLLTVERVLARFPDAKFFVSDEYHAPPIPDPFLAVLYGEDVEPLVIERWDEPSFRG